MTVTLNIWEVRTGRFVPATKDITSVSLSARLDPPSTLFRLLAGAGRRGQLEGAVPERGVVRCLRVVSNAEGGALIGVFGGTLGGRLGRYDVSAELRLDERDEEAPPASARPLLLCNVTSSSSAAGKFCGLSSRLGCCAHALVSFPGDPLGL